VTVFAHHSRKPGSDACRICTQTKNGAGFLLFSIVICFLISNANGGSPAAAQPKDDAVLLDGLAVLAGGKSWNESDSIPILLSDVEFAAALIMIRERGPIDTLDTFPDSVRIRARRWAVVVRLLARQAGQFKETTNPRDVAALRNELIEKAGGPEAMQQLLTRFGVDDTALTQWVENALLAALQVRYIVEQVDVPASKIEDPISNGKQKKEEGYLKTQRRMILRERTELTMKKWLASILAVDEVRIVQ
jgi:hypothetical protein